MSDVGSAVLNPPDAQTGAQNRIAELKVSGHLMTLDTGLFCVFQAPDSPAVNERSGLPGVRISLPPGPAGRPEAAQISTFGDGGGSPSTIEGAGDGRGAVIAQQSDGAGRAEGVSHLSLQRV